MIVMAENNVYRSPRLDVGSADRTIAYPAVMPAREISRYCEAHASDVRSSSLLSSLVEFRANVVQSCPCVTARGLPTVSAPIIPPSHSHLRVHPRVPTAGVFIPGYSHTIPEHDSLFALCTGRQQTGTIAAMLFRGLLFWLGLLPLSVLAALDDKAKMANRTIERVSSDCSVRRMGEDGCRAGLGTSETDEHAQTISLRTHSLFPPYIDQDLQNRCAGAVLLTWEGTDVLQVVGLWRGCIRRTYRLFSLTWSSFADAQQNTNKHIRLTRDRPSQMVCIVCVCTRVLALIVSYAGLAMVACPADRFELHSGGGV